MDPFLGAVMPMAFSFAPVGWYSCEGQKLSIAQNTALFSLLGTNYGGDGQSTFGLPDLRGRVIIGQGQGPNLSNYEVGEAGGNESATMSTTSMPAHTHAIVVNANQLSSESNDPENSYLGGGTANNYTNSAADGQMNTAGNVALPVGGNQPFSIINPYVAMYYNIAYEGIFPPRP